MAMAFSGNIWIFGYRACEEAPPAGALGGPPEGRGVQGVSPRESIEIVLQTVSRGLDSATTGKSTQPEHILTLMCFILYRVGK